MNLETIHTHDVLAERYGTVGELRGELDRGERPARHTELRSGSHVTGPRSASTAGRAGPG